MTKSEDELNEQVAILKYRTGEKLQFSTGIHGQMTYGFGDLDDWGFWQYPLPYKELRKDHKDAVDSLNRKES